MMAAWFTVYCSPSVGHVTASEILARGEGWDYHTVAEVYGIDDDETVNQALALLNFEPVGGPGTVRFRLSYGPPSRRPVLIHVFADPESVEEVRDEAEELLDAARGEG